MKRIYPLVVLIIALVFSVDICYGQQRAEMPRKKMHAFYKSSLNVDSAKAEQVLQIMLSYKEAVRQVTGNPGNSATRGREIQTLMDDKNDKLEAILTKEQQVKIIPTAERDTIEIRKVRKS